MCFVIFLNEKTPFLAEKSKSLESRKIEIQSKELVCGFCPKLAIFPTFFFANLVQENAFYHILQQQKIF